MSTREHEEATRIAQAIGVEFRHVILKALREAALGADPEQLAERACIDCVEALQRGVPRVRAALPWWRRLALWVGDS